MLGAIGAMAPLLGGSGGGDQAQDQQSGANAGPATGGAISNGNMKTAIKTGASTGIPMWLVVSTIFIATGIGAGAFFMTRRG